MGRRNNSTRTGAPRPNAPAPPIAKKTDNGLFSFVTPTEFVELPSGGKYYPEDHPLAGVDTIEIRHMTAKEEDILASTALAKKGLVLDRLLENILVLDIDPRSLLLGDRSAIMIAARMSGYGNVYETEVKCPFCEEHMDQTSLSGKRPDMREQRYKCPSGHRLSLIPNHRGVLGWR